MTVNFSIQNGIAELELDNGKVNAFDLDLVSDVNRHLDEAEKHAKVVILHGGAGKFCGGFDLSVVGGDDQHARSELITEGGLLVKRLYGFRLPLVVAADGHAVALGALILLTGDYRIGANGNVKYGLNETAIGMRLPSFGLELARDRLPKRTLTQAVLLSKIYQGDEAMEAGFLDQTTEQGTVMDAARQVAQLLTQLPGKTVALVKHDLRRVALSEM